MWKLKNILCKLKMILTVIENHHVCKILMDFVGKNHFERVILYSIQKETAELLRILCIHQGDIALNSTEAHGYCFETPATAESATSCIQL